MSDQKFVTKKRKVTVELSTKLIYTKIISMEFIIKLLLCLGE